jgi:hypothetical protein
MVAFWFFVWVVLGVPLVEFIGYWIHRLIFHDGALGSKLRRVHVKHHLEEYPPESLRPNLPEYKNAGDLPVACYRRVYYISTYSFYGVRSYALVAESWFGYWLRFVRQVCGEYNASAVPFTQQPFAKVRVL